MAATGIFAAARDTVAASLTALGLAVSLDSRNARPMSVLINPPTFTCLNNNVASINFTLMVLAAPPGNQDAENYLITTADTIMNSTISVIDGRPTIVAIGGQDIPAYEITVAVGAQRN
jgi:hypothetical protein